MPSLAPFLAALDLIDASERPAAMPFRLLRAVAAVRAGRSVADVSRDLRVRASVLEPLIVGDPVLALFETTLTDAPTHEKAAAARRILGQLLLGRVAEQVFERLYKREIGTSDLILEDSREDRTDTDYRVLNGQRRPVFRINIKFHGTLFRRATELVGLPPEDCFALATYKIHQGLRKERDETLPYVFLVVSVPGLTGESIGRLIPTDIAALATIVRLTKSSGSLKKRDFEDRLVDVLLSENAPTDFRGTVTDSIVPQLEAADWRVLSAAKADRLLRELLFDRVYAVRVRGFAQNYRNAELDMHFSLSGDLTTLHDFLRIYKDSGLHGLTSHLSRALI
jgi:hypothetical protein